MPITFNSFTPSTKIESAKVNANFLALKTLLDGLRPQIHLYIADALYVISNVSAEVQVRSGVTLFFNAVTLNVKTAPAGAAIIINIKKNGTTIFSVKPTIADGSDSGGSAAVFSAESITDGDVLTVDVDQVGTTEPGRDLSVGLSFNL